MKSVALSNFYLFHVISFDCSIPHAGYLSLSKVFRQHFCTGTSYGHQALDTKKFRELLRVAKNSFMSRQCSQLLRVGDIWGQRVAFILPLQPQGRQMGFAR